MRNFWLGCVLCLLVAPVMAQDIPAPLRDWQAWVLHDHPQHDCPFLTGHMPTPDVRRCLWPGRLDVAVNEHGGRFSVDVEVDAESRLALPGNDHHWPQQVTDQGHAIAVHDANGTPVVHLAAGQHRLAGHWSWSSMPTQLALPDVYGLVDLEVEGQSVTGIERHDHALFLGSSATVSDQADALSVEVFRRLDDGLPPRLTTRMQLAVSGHAREVTLGPALPPGFVATKLDAAIPARLDNDGKLHLQLRPGRWQVTLSARGTRPLGKVAFALPGKPWPSSETWSYADHPDLRQTRVEGRVVDARQAGVPASWRNLPAFAIADGHGLDITAGARAGQGGVSEKIRVRRQMWLNFDGAGFTVRDQLDGHIDHPMQLGVQGPWQLQNASDMGTPLLVGKGENHITGIELRQRSLDVDAGLYLPRSALGTMPANGWQVPLDSLAVRLQLPPGYHLLGAPGADQSHGSWVAGWTLLDLFLVALIALLCGRLLGWPMALVAAVYLVLAHGQPYAPYLTLLLAAALALLTRALPNGRLRAVTHGTALAFVAVAILWSLPYAATQLRGALYPQLEASQPHEKIVHVAFVKPTPKALKRVEPSSAPLPSMQELSSDAMPAPPSEPPAPGTRKLPSLQANTGPVQSGPGIPDWNAGNHYRLSWSGPVTTVQTMRLVIAPAWLVRLLRVVAVLALAMLFMRLLARWLPTTWQRGRWLAGSATWLVVMIVLSTPGAARAGDATPPQAMLKQLQQRLLEPPACVPDCALFANGRIKVADDHMQLLLQTQVEAPVAVPLPMTGDGAHLQTVHVDGHPARLTREGDQPLLRLDRGVHSVQLEWRIRSDALHLAFGTLKPKHLQVSAPGWVVSGLDDARLTGDTVRLSRQQTATAQEHPDGGHGSQSQSFPTYVHLTRTLRIGTDWHVRNTVQRIAPAQAGFSVSLPLLPGEHPLDDDAQVGNGRITVDFRAGQQLASWTSRIEPFDALDLEAPPLTRRSESWQIQSTSTWHVDGKGLPPKPANGMLSYAPLPGETLKLRISKPTAVTGTSVAMDTVRLDTSIGEHARDMQLTITARSTHGGEHTITVPDTTQLLRARRDGDSLPVALRNGRISLPLRPGAHDYSLALRQSRDLGLVTRTPTVDLDAPVANIDLGLTLPHDRWVLWTWGPQNGPAVLYWPQLIVLLLVAFCLARFAPTPLKLRHWILLGLGFSTFAWSAFALVAVWLILLGLRERSRGVQDLPRLGFNLIQVGLALLTLLALLVLVGVVPSGLLGQPNMHIAGNGSTSRHLRWMLDRSTGALPRGGVLSLPLWCYKLAILTWALWLANALVRWLRWAFGAWSRGGYWRSGKAGGTPDPQSQADDA